MSHLVHVLYAIALCIIPILLKRYKPSVQRNFTKDGNMRYILYVNNEIYKLFPMIGQELFIKRNCSYQNCILGINTEYNLTKFDAVIINGPYTINFQPPIRRSPYQRYIFMSQEPAAYHTMCQFNFDGFYNLTWTYKLDSDIPFTYITVRDKLGNIIGPKEDMQWISADDMSKSSLDEDLRNKLSMKSKPVAWFVSHCDSINKREEFTRNLQKELSKFGLSIDTYGECGNLNCSRGRKDVCLRMLGRDYYFYLSFENSFCEDYVTEKLLYPLTHYTVPIVYGGANYTKFMPDGSYLDARKLGAEKLARQMNELMQDREEYYQYFKWHNFYSYYDSLDFPDSDPYCQLCAVLNDKEVMSQNKIYQNFTEWWEHSKQC